MAKDLFNLKNYFGGGGGGSLSGDPWTDGRRGSGFGPNLNFDSQQPHMRMPKLQMPTLPGMEMPKPGSRPMPSPGGGPGMPWTPPTITGETYGGVRGAPMPPQPPQQMPGGPPTAPLPTRPGERPLPQGPMPPQQLPPTGPHQQPTGPMPPQQQPPFQMQPLNPQILLGILHYLASTPALGGGGQEALAGFQSPQVAQLMQQVMSMLPSAWLPQLRAQFTGSQYAGLI